MKYIFELSKENKTIPKAEVLSCLAAENINYIILESNDDVLILDMNCGKQNLKRISDRLSFTFYINKMLFVCPIDFQEIKRSAKDNKIDESGSIAVRCKNRSKNVDSQKIVKTLAEVYTKNREVSLEKAEIELRALITDSYVYVGVKIYEINRSVFEKRKVQKRPFFSPISMHPKIARALVNITSVGKNQTLLDPFCGTGGILIEAGLIGAKVFGADIENKMIQGTKQNLDFYGIRNYKLSCLDIGEIYNLVKKVDAIVTDLPYGKSTTTKGEDIFLLYNRAFESISKILKKDGRAVIGLSNVDMLKIGEKYLSLCETHMFRAHRSLIRYFCVFQRP